MINVYIPRESDKIKVNVSGSGKFDPGSIKVHVAGTGKSDYPVYEGEIVVASTIWNEQILPTKNHVLKSDITVEPIPIYEVSNPQGGITVTIG